MTNEQMQERMRMAQSARAARLTKIGPVMSDLLGEQAKQQRLQEIRHQNERAELAEQHEKEISALAEKEKPAKPDPSK